MLLDLLLFGALTLQSAAPAPQVAPPGMAQGASVAAAPARLIIESPRRSGEIFLVNTGESEGHYQLSFIQFEMKENGDVVAKGLDELKPSDRFAGDLLRFSPRELSLKPGESQVIRFRLRKPADLAEGEYRAHLFIRAIPEGPADVAKIEKGQMSIKIRPIYGLSVPIFLRQGKVSAQPGLTDLSVTTVPGGHLLRFAITRRGLASVYGNLEATWRPTGAKESQVIGELNGVAVYAEIPRRWVEMGLEVPPGAALAHGTLTLLYRRAETGEVLTQAELRIP